MNDIYNMKQFIEQNEQFKEFVHKNMLSYNRTLEEELSSPITRNYYESLQPDGCNYRREELNHDV